MVFTFDGTCSKCGDTIHFVIDINNPQEIPYFAKCTSCGSTATSADCERIYHIMDTLESFEQRNSLGAISRITVRRSL